MSSATFPCPWCGAPITGASPGATFTCPYCQSKVTAPHDGMGAMRGGPVSAHGAAPIGMPVQPSRPAAILDASAGAVVPVLHPQRGWLFVGPHAPDGQPPRLRAIDAEQNQVLWETLQGQSWVSNVTAGSMLASANNLYVASNRGLVCLDISTGARKWGMQLADNVATQDGPLGVAAAVYDPFPPQGRGAILVMTIDHTLYALDRDSGQVLWSAQKECELTSLDGHGAVIASFGFPYVKADIINPAYAQPVATVRGSDWSADIGKVHVAGPMMLLATDDFPGDGDQGAAVVDAMSGRIVFFEPVEDLCEDVVPAAMAQRVFFAADDGRKLYVGPGGMLVPSPAQNFGIVAIRAAGPTLVLLLRKLSGSSVRRVIGIDPATLQFRFDCGELGTEPDDDFPAQLQTDGYSCVFVASPNDDSRDCELRSVDTSTGRTLWTRKVGHWHAHTFIAGHVVVRAGDRLEVLAAPTGKVVATFPRP
ncbi:MAG: PQQ-binding-like beta-propeller repeat protein [Polyangiaceae bacterium]|nr:PQQ-binding-like beta-propeller repeat protein [Polyangiaceae bacterium]